jgi:hypothetical protein
MDAKEIKSLYKSFFRGQRVGCKVFSNLKMIEITIKRWGIFRADTVYTLHFGNNKMCEDIRYLYSFLLKSNILHNDDFKCDFHKLEQWWQKYKIRCHKVVRIKKV